MKKIKCFLFLLLSFVGLMLLSSINASAEEVVFNVNDSNVKVNINGQELVSDDNYLVRVEKSTNGTYNIFSDLMKVKEYTFSDEEVLSEIELLIPKTISLSSDNIYFSNSKTSWLIKAVVTFYDGSSQIIDVNYALNNLETNELVFNNVALSHELYNISEKVNLKRITNSIEEYQNSFNSLKTLQNSFKSNCLLVKEKYDALIELYNENNVSDETLNYFNEYLNSQSIAEDNLNEWLGTVVDSIELKDKDISVIYGDDISSTIIIKYLNGQEEKQIAFDYEISNINNDKVEITSKEKVTSEVDGVIVYDDYVSFTINLVKRKLYSDVFRYAVAYTGKRHELSISVSNVSVKFSDSVSNESLKYFVDGKETEPILVNRYTVVYDFDITNREFYDFSEFVVNDFTIVKGTINNITFENQEFVYNHGNPIEFGVSTNILSDGNEATISYYRNGKLIDKIYNVGVYHLDAVVKNENYENLSLSAIVTVVEAETNIGYDMDTDTMEYNYNNYDYKIKNKVYEDGRIASVTYAIYKGNLEVDSIVNVGTYEVIVTIVDSGGNYKRKTDRLTVRVTPKPIEVEYISEEYIYNGNKQTPRVSSNIRTLSSYNTDDGFAPSNAGSYTMISYSADSNFKITNSTYNFTIKPARVLLDDFVSKEIEYCNGNVIGNIEILNLYNDDEVSVVLEYRYNNEVVSEIVNVGEGYVVMAVELTGASAGNYTLEGIVTQIGIKVIPKNIIVTPINATKVYLNEDANIQYSISPSLYEGDSISGRLSRESGENVGKYRIVINTLDAGENYNLIIDRNQSYFEITPRPIEYSYLHNTYIYDGFEKHPSININGPAHIEHDPMINAGVYYVRIVIDDSNYCLPENYKDIEIVVSKRDISNQIEITKNVFVYTGSNPNVELLNGNYNFLVEFYDTNNQKIDSAIMPGNYIVKIIVDERNYTSNKDIAITITKMVHESIEVDIEAFYNKIVVEKNDKLEYKINNGDYSSSNVFNWLDELQEYTITVRVKEDEVGYASPSLTYAIKTTRNPEIVNNLITILPDNISEYGLLTLKSIVGYMKDTNEKDLDKEKLDKYVTIKAKYDNLLNNYNSDVEDANKMIKSFNSYYVYVSTALLTFAMFIVLKRKIRL